MTKLGHLFDNNRQWAESMTRSDPEFFARLSKRQTPQYLWIGCSDSRVPVNQIIGLQPGEVFVHRNVANIVAHTDINCFSVIQYAVETLKVRHIIVCGHYGCGGVRAAAEDLSQGVIHDWLNNIREIRAAKAKELDRIADKEARVDRLCELNVVEQVRHVAESAVVQTAWKTHHDLTIHGWIYRLDNGLLDDLNCSLSGIPSA